MHKKASIFPFFLFKKKPKKLRSADNTTINNNIFWPDAHPLSIIIRLFCCFKNHFLSIFLSLKCTLIFYGIKKNNVEKFFNLKASFESHYPLFLTVRKKKQISKFHEQLYRKISKIYFYTNIILRLRFIYLLK